jgi:hypothetical protein
MNGYTSTTLAVNCVFTGNAANLGGAIFNFVFSSPTIVNCSIVSNQAFADAEDVGGGVHNFAGSSASFVNDIVWANQPRGIGGIDAPFTYSCIEGGHPGEGNLSSTPFFAHMPAPGEDGQWGTLDDIFGDLQLLLGSNCIDAGDNSAVPLRAVTDFAHQPRVVDDPATPNMGNPDGMEAMVDIGAYEFQPLLDCVADILPEGGDGVVDQQDLMAVLDGWGNCNTKLGCPADIVPPGGNGVVNIDDLMRLIQTWGACP